MIQATFRSSRRRCSVKEGVPKNFTKFTGKYLCQSLFLKACDLVKKETPHRCFSENFAKILRTPFLQNTSGRLVLNFINRDFEISKTFFVSFSAKIIYGKCCLWGTSCLWGDVTQTSVFKYDLSVN